MSKSKYFSDYQKVLSFTINLCYADRDFNILRLGNGWKVLY